MIVSAPREFNRAYVLHGCGGLTTVQARLAEYGMCYSSFWDPSPPDWRFRYMTCLRPDELLRLLEDVKGHFVIRFFQDSAVYESRFVFANC